MKRWKAWVAVVMGGLFLGGCNTAVDQGQQPASLVQGPSLLLSETGGPTRTILPALPAGSQYAITLGPVGGTTSIVTTSTLLDPIPVTESGPYTVQVTIRDSLGTDLATSAVLNVSVGMGPTTLFVPLSPVGTADGSATFNLSWPVVDVDWLEVTLVDLLTMTAYSTTSATPGERAAGALNLNLGTIPAGSYLLKVAPDITGMVGDHPVWSSVVQIWPGLTTSTAIALSSADMIQAPNQPSNLQVTQEGLNVVVTWKDESTTESNFRLYNSGTYFPPAKNTNTTRHAFPGVPGTTYVFSASAINARGESAQTAPVTFTYRVSPTRPTINEVGFNLGDDLVTPDDNVAIPIHQVPLVSGLQMGVTEVTYPQWRQVKDKFGFAGPLSSYYIPGSFAQEGASGTPGAAPTVDRQIPVTNIRWRDAIVWCNALSVVEGLTPVYYSDSGFTVPIVMSSLSAFSATAGSQDNPYIKMAANGYRLPTEAEWEAAARWLGPGSFAPGTYASGATSAAEAASRTVGWLWPDSPTDVALKKPNAYGLYDMTGNVGEWCQDWYGIYTTATPYTDSDSLGATSGLYRVFRGQVGIDIATHPSGAAVSYRSAEQSSIASNAIGFRVVRRP